jgi:hypothetical protein
LIGLCPVSSVTRVARMATFVKVIASNDADKDVHYRAIGNAGRTLCGMAVAGLAAKEEMTCARCHQFASGNI